MRDELFTIRLTNTTPDSRWTTMNRCTILLVCAVLDVASSVATSYNDIYLDWINLGDAIFRHRQETRNVLVAIGVTEGDQAEVILDKIKKTCDQFPIETSEHDVCNGLSK